MHGIALWFTKPTCVKFSNRCHKYNSKSINQAAEIHKSSPMANNRVHRTSYVAPCPGLQGLFSSSQVVFHVGVSVLDIRNVVKKCAIGRTAISI